MTTETSLSDSTYTLLADLTRQLDFLKGNLKGKRGLALYSAQSWIATVELVYQAVLEDTVTDSLVWEFTNQGCRLAGAIPSLNATVRTTGASHTAWIVNGPEMQAQVRTVRRYATMLEDRVKRPWK